MAWISSFSCPPIRKRIRVFARSSRVESSRRMLKDGFSRKSRWLLSAERMTPIRESFKAVQSTVFSRRYIKNSSSSWK